MWRGTSRAWGTQTPSAGRSMDHPIVRRCGSCLWSFGIMLPNVKREESLPTLYTSLFTLHFSRRRSQALLYDVRELCELAIHLLQALARLSEALLLADQRLHRAREI